MKLSNFKKIVIFFQEKAFLIFQKTESSKNSFIFHETELSYISGNGSSEKFSYISGNGTFRSQKNEKTYS